MTNTIKVFINISILKVKSLTTLTLGGQRVFNVPLFYYVHPLVVVRELLLYTFWLISLQVPRNLRFSFRLSCRSWLYTQVLHSGGSETWVSLVVRQRNDRFVLLLETRSSHLKDWTVPSSGGGKWRGRCSRDPRTSTQLTSQELLFRMFWTHRLASPAECNLSWEIA